MIVTSRHRFPTSPRLIIAAAATGLIVAAALVVPGGNAFAADTPVSQPHTNAKTSTNPFKDGKYIVTLKDPAAATYAGGIKSFASTKATTGHNLQATSAKVKNYASYLHTEQTSVAKSVNAKVVSSYTLALNGFSGTLSADQAETLAGDSRVQSVTEDQIVHVQNAVSSTDFLKLTGPDGVWAGLGGADKAGAGIVVGDIDTGIAPENASFAGDTLGTTSGADPYKDGSSIVFKKSDGATFTGQCVEGVQFTSADCSTKIIGARYFVDNFGLDQIKGVDSGEYASPRDGNGHGSHTASTAAGDASVPAAVAGKDMGIISGVAPAAKLAIYKACWTGVSGDGCDTADLVEAIDAAVSDGVDVINFSIGGGAAQTTTSLTDTAFMGAAAAGIFVSAAAGNDGPEPSTADNASPWITTVAASTIPSYEATVAAGDGETFLGVSITLPAGANISGPVVYAGSIPATGVSGVSASKCGPGELNEAKAVGKIIICDRGANDRLDKSANVKAAGGIGMILANVTPDSLDLDLHTVPTIALNSESYQALREYAALADASVTFEDGNTSDKPSVATPQVAGFSSRGPILADGGDMLKPDIAAPGVGILADGPNASGEKGTYEFMSGTSMATPHVSGLAALYLSKNPLATPAEIKSAMMTTAYNTVDQTGDPIEDPFAQGAGEVNPSQFFKPGLLYLNDIDDWKAYAQGVGTIDYGVKHMDGSELNVASISVGSLAGTETVTRTVTSTEAGTFTAAEVTMPGVNVTVNPATLTFDAAGESQQYAVTFAEVDAPVNEFTTGYLRWTRGDTTVTSPMAVRPVELAAPAEVDGTGDAGSVSIPVAGGEDAGIDLVTSGLTKGQATRGSGKEGDPATAFIVTVPDNTPLVRLDLKSDDQDADLDLVAYLILPTGGTQFKAASTSTNADERLDLVGPEAGQYIVEVVYSTAPTDVGFTFTSYVMSDSDNAGNFTATPSPLPIKTGTGTDATASWSGLKPGSSYIGEVTFGDTGVNTFVTVTTDPLTEPPVAAGTLKLAVDPQYIRPNRGTTVIGSGLVPGEAFGLYLDDQTDPIVKGFASDSGAMAQFFIVPASASFGHHLITIRAGDQTADAEVNLAPITVNQILALNDFDYDGSATVSIDAFFSGRGTLLVEIEDADGKIVSTYKQPVVAQDDFFDSADIRTPEVKLDAGHYKADVSVVDDEGTTSQLHQDSFTIDGPGDPSSVTMDTDIDDPDSVDLTVTNNTIHAIYPSIEYKTCSGPVIFSNVGVSEQNTLASTLDFTGFASATVRVDSTVVAQYTNTSAGRCADTYTVAQPLWITMADKGATSDPDRPITATVSNRYAAYSYGYDLHFGTGTKVLVDEISHEEIPVDFLSKAGPVIESPFLLKQDQSYWVAALFEDFPPGKQSQKISQITAASVTLRDLQPEGAPEPVLSDTPTPPATDATAQSPALNGAPVPPKLTVKAAAGLHLWGKKMTVTAAGMAPGERWTLSIGGKDVATGTASGAGTVKRLIVVPHITEGERTVRIIGITKKHTATTATDVVAPSKTLKVSVTHPRAHPKALVTIVVRGFAPAEPVRIVYGNHRLTSAHATATKTGTYKITIHASIHLGSKIVAARGLTAKRTGHTKLTAK